MFARYDQDLSPFFERIRALERQRQAERKHAVRESFRAVLALFGLRRKA